MLDLTKIVFNYLSLFLADKMDSEIIEDAKEGDKIRIENDDQSFEGILMPHHRFSGEEVITLKLDNGYNIGVEVDESTEIQLLRKQEDIETQIDDRVQLEIDENKPKISILGTGGTIASYVEYKTGAVHPAQDEDDVIYSNPELVERCYPEVEIVLSKLSEDIVPEDWVMLADKIIEKFEDGAEGIVISHGTDTMGYTASALSFLLEGLSKPVVLVGSQRSSDRPSSDAHLNLLGAVEVAKSGKSGVFVVMHETSSDKKCAIHRGTKVRKMHTSRRDAFESINSEPVGYVDPFDGKVEFDQKFEGSKQRLKRKGKMEKDVALIQANPAMDEKDIENLKQKEGIVISGTGLGHIRTDLVPKLKELIDMEIPVIMTSQCLYGSVNNNVYSAGRELREAGVISGEDMLPETALVKLMWSLTLEEDTRKVMKKNIAGEITERRVE